MNQSIRDLIAQTTVSTSTVPAPVGKSLTTSEILIQMQNAMLQAARMQAAPRIIDPIEAYLRAQMYGEAIYERPMPALSDFYKPFAAPDPSAKRDEEAINRIFTGTPTKEKEPAPFTTFKGFTVKAGRAIDDPGYAPARKQGKFSSPDLAGEWKPFEFGSAHLKG